MSEQGLVVSVQDHVARVVLDRPGRLNALSSDLRTALVDAFDRFETDEDVWVVLLTGTGDRAFCAGLDLKELDERRDGGTPGELLMRGTGRNVFETVLECSKPVVAALNGWALGAGCELALACDIRLAAEHARIGMPEAKRGLGANFGSQMLTRIVPRGVAFEMLYTGEPIGTEQALHWGLVNHVFPPEQLDAEATAFAQGLASNAPLSLRRYKAMIGKGSELPLSAALRLSAGPNPYDSEDRKEGVRAFTEKRPPRWQAR
ncbi:enoyl-CoA hydratase/isomerase family protein [Allosaccharopolyspora coralli]|uniref:Enoyl-CoA hydratase/isomerase family protein n=1 Tax=Allosaccharopolyspora coralli TaxID=2665642 RepID=A0A5Q3QGN0_9PSEU|nr:enoyl-CoA hydratase-related protein [Allosaccharopolyspora coralli]QGK70619.1 enoyl-CoA hydratase/isomerase family protein [Allosaccharopolyspora coralli]